MEQLLALLHQLWVRNMDRVLFALISPFNQLYIPQMCNLHFTFGNYLHRL